MYDILSNIKFKGAKILCAWYCNTDVENKFSVLLKTFKFDLLAMVCTVRFIWICKYNTLKYFSIPPKLFLFSLMINCTGRLLMESPCIGGY